MSFSPKDLIRRLEQNGFEYKRTKGSHNIYENPKTGKSVIVPLHGNKDLPKGTYFGILKQAGTEK